MKKVINWKAVFLHWLTENLRRDRKSPYAYKELCIKFDIAHKTIRTHASKGQWQQKLNDKLLEQNQQVIAKVQEQELISEVEVRQRQAMLSREMIDMAMTKLKSIKPHDLTIKQAIDLARLGLMEERKALGLPDKYEVTNLNNSSGDFITVEARIKRFEKIDGLTTQLIEYIGQDCN
jgi:hypothetical protein